MAELRGKVALVTGSTSGIGLGIAHALAGAGADIVMNGFGDPGDIARLREDIASRHGVRVAYVPADISDAYAVAQMVAQGTAELGAVDVLVNNAGIQFVAPIESFPPAEWGRVIAVNLTGAFLAMQAAIPGMKARGWGRIINIASAHGLVASAEKSAYVAAKHGLVGLTKVAALELANDGVTCNAICPGWVLTPLVEVQVKARAEAAGITVEEAKRQMVTEKQAMNRFTTPEQIGATAVFLCSEGAATITGTSISVDGGWVAQ
ncbi:MAG: 3-hydroxybutyrate dehydrogenase [Acetobacteraceae bacterium]|nr:3-hydroxybutyrate dehydrogenase [Acetobacteraceae bacterium]